MEKNMVYKNGAQAVGLIATVRGGASQHADMNHE